jgi:adenine/guanine phosphoribosyltransferase-like PRPP-binding protein
MTGDDGLLRLHTSYMRHAFGPWRAVVAQAKLFLAGRDYDTLVGTGLSGGIIVPRLAASLKTNWMIVRKPGDGTHSFRQAEGTLGHRWVFVDDLIDSGATLKRTKEAIDGLAAQYDHKTKHIGCYLYNDAQGRWEDA